MYSTDILVSITLSTFNVEKYITKSLSSIIKQSYKHTEIICIDDASTDNTLNIINHFAAQDKRINVISKTQNEGLAVARNKSLELAKGKYVLFLDGDDIYDLTMIEKAVNLAEQDNSDMVLWDYLVFYDESEINQKRNEKSELTDFDTMTKIKFLQRPSFTWTKLIKTDVAQNLKIHFPERLTRQDIPVHWHLITQLDKISILPEKLSFYRQQIQATTAQKNTKLFDLAYVMDIVKNYLVKHNLFENYKTEFLKQRLNLLFGMYDSIDKLYKTEAMVIILERLSEEEHEYILSSNDLRPQARWFYKSYYGDIISSIKYNLWFILRGIYRKLK